MKKTKTYKIKRTREEATATKFWKLEKRWTEDKELLSRKRKLQLKLAGEEIQKQGSVCQRTVERLVDKKQQVFPKEETWTEPRQVAWLEVFLRSSEMFLSVPSRRLMVFFLESWGRKTLDLRIQGLFWLSERRWGKSPLRELINVRKKTYAFLGGRPQENNAARLPSQKCEIGR